ncbi:TonB family protein [Myxococcota bacterium]|nr:TonB family protein [Myxococcota bacterium]MBU1379808.1 TonB family protein [Myxococcota bacterium]MBU1497130.1 TonB family protein [Myxococcota bacterium]
MPREKHRYKTERKKKSSIIWLMFFVSILAHALLGWFVYISKDTKPPPDDSNKKKLTIVQLFKSEAKNDKAPADTEKVSTENSNSSNETIDRTTKAAAPPPEVVVMPEDEPPTPLPKAPPRPKALRKTVKPAETVIAKPIVAPAVKDASEKKEKDIDNPASPPKKTHDKPREIKLFPTETEAKQILGIDTKEHQPNVKSGDTTVLKAKKWIGSSFFLRVREAVAQVWDPKTVYSRHDSDGTIYGFKNWFTILRITLDSKGRLVKTIIIRRSGLTFLDQEAIRAFKAAAPFLNPPAEIVNPTTGNITFSFGFYVEVTSKIDFKLFKF